jgi:hypothetical protein
MSQKEPIRAEDEMTDEQKKKEAKRLADKAENAGIIGNENTKFRRVIFNQRMNENEPIDVEVSCQGEVLKAQRGKMTIMPVPHLDILEHGSYNKYSHQPGKGRKVVGVVSPYTWQDMGPATFEEFQLAYDAGTKKTREMVARFGLQIPVEESVPQTL